MPSTSQTALVALRQASLRILLAPARTIIRWSRNGLAERHGRDPTKLNLVVAIARTLG